jgi:hypothetical protein
VKTKNTPEGTLFILENTLDGRGKWLFAWHAVSFMVPAGFLMYLFFLLPISEDFGTWLVMLLGIACIIAGYRYLSSAWRRDTLLITEESVTLSQRKGLRASVQHFNRAEISNMRFLDKPEVTPHALAGKSFDYLGFETEQRVISEVFGDHRIAFDYEGRTVTFGRALYSWDFDRIVEAITGQRTTESMLPWNEPLSHLEYWHAFQELTMSFSATQSFIRQEMENAKIDADGSLEGWMDHRRAMKTVHVRFDDQLTVSQKQKLQQLIDYVTDVINVES